MKPVYQTRYGAPDGNCMNACIASLLEIPLEEIDFVANDETWQYEFNNRLRPYGVFLLSAKWGTISPVPDNQYVIASGKNKKGIQHAIVAKLWMEAGNIHLGHVHDPNKNNAPDEIQEIDCVYFLAKMDIEKDGLDDC